MRLIHAPRVFVFALAVSLLALGAGPQRAAPAPASPSIQTADLREWLDYIASDELEGRQVFQEGLGLAASYIADHLAQWTVKPAGPGVAAPS
jgi:hypothetical protein